MFLNRIQKCKWRSKLWIFNLQKYLTVANNMKNMKMFGPSKLLHNIEEAVLRVMDHLSRLKIMMWKWIILSKKENKITLSYRHHFAFIVVGKMKLVTLKQKVSIFVLQYSILFLGLLLGIIFLFHLPDHAWSKWFWSCVWVFFSFRKSFSGKYSS